MTSQIKPSLVLMGLLDMLPSSIVLGEREEMSFG